MPLPRLIPCLDVAGGRVVKGVRFQGLRDVGDPVELGEAYSDAGADELVFLDVAATIEERDTLVDLVRRVAERLAIPFTVGGGIRTVGDAEALLEAGADKVSVNSAALARPELLTALAERLGSQAVVLAIDATGGDVRSHAGGVETGRRAAEWAREGEERGAGEILLTSIDTDGTRDGYDLGLTEEVAAAVSVPVIASGGAGSAGHVAAALEVAQAALLASILHENPARLETLRAELRGLGVPLGMPPEGELRAAIVQDAESGRVLMLAWMDDEALRLTRETGEAHFYSRSREPPLAQGRDLREHAGRRGAARRLRRRRLPPPRPPERARVPHGLGLLLRALALAHGARARRHAAGGLLRREAPGRRARRGRAEARRGGRRGGAGRGLGGRRARRLGDRRPVVRELRRARRTRPRSRRGRGGAPQAASVAASASPSPVPS